MDNAVRLPLAVQLTAGTKPVDLTACSMRRPQQHALADPRHPFDEQSRPAPGTPPQPRSADRQLAITLSEPTGRLVGVRALTAFKKSDSSRHWRATRRRESALGPKWREAVRLCRRVLADRKRFDEQEVTNEQRASGEAAATRASSTITIAREEATPYRSSSRSGSIRTRDPVVS
jgi:hypothetical protein